MPDFVEHPSSFIKELQFVLNRYSMENESNTPDFIPAQYIQRCLDSLNASRLLRRCRYGAVIQRDHWYDQQGVELQPTPVALFTDTFEGEGKGAWAASPNLAPGFTCPRCGMTSHNPNDATYQCCGNCYQFFGYNRPEVGTPLGNSPKPYDGRARA